LTTPTIRDNRGREIVNAHWNPRNPESRPFPHLHIGASVLDVEHPHFRDGFASLHIPTGLITVEDIVRFLIEELQVRSSHQDWKTTIQETREAHSVYRPSL